MYDNIFILMNIRFSVLLLRCKGRVQYLSTRLLESKIGSNACRSLENWLEKNETSVINQV